MAQGPHFAHNINVPVKSKLKHPPPGISRAFDVFCCTGGREFDELSLPQGRAFDHYSQGVRNLIASFDFVLRRADSTWRDKSWRRQALMRSKRKIPDSWQTGWGANVCTSFALYLKVLKNHLYYLWHVKVPSIKPCLHTQFPERNRSYWKVSRRWGHLITWNGPIMGHLNSFSVSGGGNIKYAMQKVVKVKGPRKRKGEGQWQTISIEPRTWTKLKCCSICCLCLIFGKSMFLVKK